MTVEEELILLRDENIRLKSLLQLNDSLQKQNFTIEELVDIDKLKIIFEKFSKLTGYTAGFVKQDTREVLISTGWTEICKTHHRGHESSAQICQNSNAELTKNLNTSKHIHLHQCQHGMVDGATPIIIDGKHLANLFSGQVLFHKPDLEDFKESAEHFGYDMEGYLKALSEVKIISQEKLHDVLEFLASIAKLVAELGKEKKEYLILMNSLEGIVLKRTEELEQVNKKLEVFANNDALTHLMNRRKIDNELTHLYNQYIKCQTPFSIIIMDIDFFKSVNDLHGHHVGDAVLKEVAHILRSNARNSDIIGRWGGEEFLIICSYTDEKGAFCVAEKLRNSIQNHPFTTIGHKTASFGLSQMRANLTPEEILQEADQALYYAKKHGRNQSIKFSDLLCD